MTKATKVSSAVTSRYATAFIELAEESRNVEKVEKDLKELAAMLSSSADLATLVHSPTANKAQQIKALTAIAEKAQFQDLTKNFLGVLVKNRRISALAQVIEAVHAGLSKRRGEITAEIQTAQDLTDKQLKDIQAALTKGLGQEVAIKARVEPSILGGMIVTVGSQMIDDSVARKLERLKTAMGRQANENTNEAKKEA